MSGDNMINPPMPWFTSARWAELRALLKKGHPWRKTQKPPPPSPVHTCPHTI